MNLASKEHKSCLCQSKYDAKIIALILPLLTFFLFVFFFLLPVEPGQLSGGCELTVVLQDFTAGHSSELSVQVGQTVELLERPSERPGWCLVRTTERSPPQEGLVPSSALCISHSRSSVEMDCFFPSGKGRQQPGWAKIVWVFPFCIMLVQSCLGCSCSRWVKAVQSLVSFVPRSL